MKDVKTRYNEQETKAVKLGVLMASLNCDEDTNPYSHDKRLVDLSKAWQTGFSLHGTMQVISARMKQAETIDTYA